jgi:ankyrin repeat protein
MKTTLTVLLLAVTGFTTSSLAVAQDAALDGCWYRWGSKSFGSGIKKNDSTEPAKCTVHIASSQATISCNTRKENRIIQTSETRVIQARLRPAGNGNLELTTTRIATDGKELKAPNLNVALSYAIDGNKLFTVARGPDLQAKDLQTSQDIVQSSHRRLPVDKNQCQSIGTGARDPSGVFNLPKPSTVSVNLGDAIRSVNFDLAQALLASGGDINCVNCDENPPLVLAVFLQNNTQEDRLSWVLANKADPNIESLQGAFGPNGGMTGFLRFAGQFARWVGREETSLTSRKAIEWFNKLLDAGANVKAVTNDQSTFLHLYAGEAFNWQINLQKVEGPLVTLIARGADINALDSVGYTPLMRGLMGGYNGQRRCPLDQVNQFLALGTNTSITGLDGKRAFDIAMENAAAGDRRCNALLPLLK